MLTGCAPDVPDRLLAVDGREGSYDVTEVALPELTDPWRMEGELGNGRVGGYLAGDLAAGELHGYGGGGPIRLDYAIEGGVGVPLDQDGLVLWSYYNALAGFRRELDEVGVDTSDVFPVPFAYQPSVAGTLLSSNAAYVSDVVHLFVLVPDSGAGLPLAANPGVIRHEFGHALFQSIVGGDVAVSTPQIRLATVSALNEGFADTVAVLALDDPNFIEISVDVQGTRDVTGDWTTVGTAAPEDDPYSRGTVYASFAWDLRELTDDPPYVLARAVGALETWSAAEAWNDDIPGIDRYPAILADAVIADRPALADDICGAFATRFPDSARPAGC